MIFPENIEVQFARIPDCGIAVFRRTCACGSVFTERVSSCPDCTAEDESPIYMYNGDDEHWDRTFDAPKFFVNMYDLCPAYERKSFEYRVWYEHLLGRLIKGLRGDGILTVVQRKHWPWYVGFAWSRFPLAPAFSGMTDEPPDWWGAEDLWAECEGFEQLLEDILSEQRRLILQHHYETARLRGENV